MLDSRKAGQSLHSPASLWMTSGRSFGKAVKQVPENPAIRVLEDTIICDLLTLCGGLWRFDKHLYRRDHNLGGRRHTTPVATSPYPEKLHK